MGRVEEVDPPTGSGSLLSPTGGRAAALHLGAAERQSTFSSSTFSIAVVATVFKNYVSQKNWLTANINVRGMAGTFYLSVCLPAYLCLPRLGLTVKPGS